MKVVISGSYKKIDELEEVADKLRGIGFTVHAPSRSNYVDGNYQARKKLIDEHLDFVKDCDVFLIGNVKSSKEKYGRVGTSTYFETGWAYVLGKKIYALEPIDPKSDFAEDLLALKIEVLSGTLEKGQI